MIRVSAGKHGRRRRVQVRSTCSFGRPGDYQPIKERETLYAFSFACYFSIRRVSPGSPEFEPPTGGSSNQGSLLLTQPDLQPDVFRFNRALSVDPRRGALGDVEDIGGTLHRASSTHSWPTWASSLAAFYHATEFGGSAKTLWTEDATYCDLCSTLLSLKFSLRKQPLAFLQLFLCLLVEQGKSLS